jgi:hypothetical protein
MTEW